jgi:galactofuranosylgalactofuranosylrhamnosyl-N-acetylglucosaminyl-diphospho-decaprenol beta-1,5/1,6-galactofuranosyltransferase
VTQTIQGALDSPALDSGLRVVHRTLIQADQELDVQPLYIGGVSGIATGDAGMRQSGAAQDEDPTIGSDTAQHADHGLTGYGRVTDTGAVVVEPAKRLTFGTYFNAFPASYWRRWTDFESVRLVARVRGQGTMVVYRSTSKGHVLRAHSEQIDSAGFKTVDLELSLKPFIDGGWYWFDLEAGVSELVLESAVWAVETDRPSTVRTSASTSSRSSRRAMTSWRSSTRSSSSTRGPRRSATTPTTSRSRPTSVPSCGSSSSGTSGDPAASRAR